MKVRIKKGVVTGYSFIDDVYIDKNTVFNATKHSKGVVKIPSSELVVAGASESCRRLDSWVFSISECEIVDDITPTQTDMEYIAEVEASHDITNKCCNQFGERDEMQQIINSLQADVIARGARIAELEREVEKLRKSTSSNNSNEPEYWDSCI